MQLAMIGLGRMGGNMVQRLLQGGHQVVVFDRSADAVKAHVALGAKAAKDLADLSGQLSGPRVVWVMVPAGAAVESTIEQLLPGLSKGDIIIDGGNSNFKDSIRRAAALKEKGIELHRRRHERRRLGTHGRLLPDDRGVARGVQASVSPSSRRWRRRTAMPTSARPARGITSR